MDVGTKIKRARRAKGLSLRALGAKLGVSGAAVAQWETNATRISPDNMVNLSDVLNLPISELLPRKNPAREMTIADADELLLVERFRALPPQLREAHLRLLVLQADAPDAHRKDQ